MAFVSKNVWPAGRLGTVQEPVLNQWVRVTKASATLPQTATATLFTISGGRILVWALIGEVMVAIGAGTTPDIGIDYDPTVGASSELADDLAVASDAVGTFYSVEGDTTALLETVGVGRPVLNGGIILNPGVIQWKTTESVAGEVKWDLYYMPLEPTSYVVAA